MSTTSPISRAAFGVGPFPGDQRPLLVQDLAAGCQRETAQNGRSSYVLKIRHEGEVMSRPLAVSN